MTTLQNPLVVGVFQNETEARDALLDLYNAGFKQDQLGFARPAHAADINLQEEMTRFGVSTPQAAYYENQYRDGHPVVSVRSDGREQIATRILGSHGATDVQNEGTDEQIDDARPLTDETYDPKQRQKGSDEIQ